MDNVEPQTMRLLGTVPAAEMRSAAVHFQKNDVLYGRLRPYLNKVITADFEGLSSAEFIPLTARPGVVPRYLQYRLNAQDFVSFASHLNEGDRPRVDWSQIGSFPVELPPSAEQRRIVDAIDSYLSRLDEAEAALERVQRNLKRYRAAVLQAAVEGRLVPTEAELARAECRDYEPASELLKRILAERRRRWEETELARLKAAGKAPKDDKWKAKYREPVPPDSEALPGLPEGWAWVNVDTVRWEAGYGTSQKCTSQAQGPPVLRIPNVQDQAVNLDKLKYATAPDDLQPDEALQLGDFLFIRTNGSQNLIGRGALVDRALPGACYFASYLIRLRLVAVGVLPEWTALAWHSSVVRRQLLAEAASSAGQYNVSLAAATRVVIPLPPMTEQRRILNEVAEISSVCQASLLTVLKSHDRCARLRQSILKWAFEGKLVDQDPNDEPASVLLERIRTERASQVHAPERRSRKQKARP